MSNRVHFSKTPLQKAEFCQRRIFGCSDLFTKPTGPVHYADQCPEAVQRAFSLCFYKIYVCFLCLFVLELVLFCFDLHSMRVDSLRRPSLQLKVASVCLLGAGSVSCFVLLERDLQIKHVETMLVIWCCMCVADHHTTQSDVALFGWFLVFFMPSCLMIKPSQAIQKPRPTTAQP